MTVKHPLQIIASTKITDAMLVSSSITENEHPVYNAGTTYAKGARVIKSHTIFESVQADNLGHDPMGQDAAEWWGKVGPTNLWAGFDLSNSTKVLLNGPTHFEFSPGAAISGLMLINCDGLGAVRVKLYHPADTLPEEIHYDTTHSMSSLPSEPTWYSWLFDPRIAKSRLIIDNLPARPGARLRLEFTPSASSATVGTIAFGRSYMIGIGVNTGLALERLDNSAAEENKYTGEIDYLMPRPPGKRLPLTVVLDPKEFDATDALLDRLVGVPCMFMLPGPFKALSLWGYMAGSSQGVPYVNAPELNLTVKGFPQ